MLDVLRQHEHRIRGAQVEQLGAARPHLAEAGLAFAGTQYPTEAAIEAGEQGAVVVFHL
ncbi:hypothetical protein [Arthrobacter sp. NicSoilB8]|uniref:hypothetical protein n=1 Tax=Arthrobacter sp. NicSoilB8 TaxID=2830998 RepID=UPI001CC3C3E6|nr:hypothetical protein [Arthrobacter sp. NicSoilB8]